MNRHQRRIDSHLIALGLCGLVAAALATTAPALAEEPPEAPRAPGGSGLGFHHSFWPPHLSRGRIGVQVQTMTPELREHMQAPSDRGLLVTRVEPDRPAAEAGLLVGDVIVAAGGAPMREPFDLVKAVASVPAGASIELKILRDGEPRVLEVSPEGEERTWIDPDHWDDLLERGLHRGSKELRRRLQELEERFKELERRFDQLDFGQQT